jgi:glycosyltransferase involved in cell wall biosynthesis
MEIMFAKRNPTNNRSNTKSYTKPVTGLNRNRPTVVVCAPVYLPSQGGAATFFSTMIDMLKDKVNFIVYTQSLKGVQTIEKHDNVRIYRIQPNLIDAPAPVKYFIIPPITILTLLGFSLKYRAIPQAHSNGIFGFTVSLFSKLFNVKMIKEVMDTSDPAYNLRLGNIARYGSIGYTIEKRLLKLGIHPDMIRAYPSLLPPTDKKKFKNIKLRELGAEKTTKLLFVGFFWPSKGIDNLLKAMKIIEAKRNDIKLTILGDGPEKENIIKFIDENNLKSVTIVGITPRDEYLTKYLANADISVLPSRSGEGNPFVILEAFQFGRPVIATRVGGTPELIKNEETGLLIEPEDPRLLAKTILRLADDKALQKRLAKNGKKFLSNFPTWDDLAKEIYDDYMKILSK